MNVFGLWLALFLVWAIMFLEVFSLTKWQENETWMQNYSTFPRAMLMLTLMSTGWVQLLLVDSERLVGSDVRCNCLLLQRGMERFHARLHH